MSRYIARSWIAARGLFAAIVRNRTHTICSLDREDKGRHRVTPDQVKAIQDSFKLVAPISEQAAALFYGRLFEIAPDVKPLFRGDMTEQGRKLMATLGVVVNSLGNLEAILPRARQAPRRLRREGARLHARRRGAPLDAGAGARQSVDAGTRASMGRRLRAPVRLLIGEAYSRSVAAE